MVNLGERVSPTDIEEGMRVGVDRQKYTIQLPLPPKIDPSVTMMQVEEKPDVTYSDVGGCKEQIERLREVVEVPLLSVNTPSMNLYSQFSPNDLSIWESILPRVSCCTDLLAQERHYVPELLQIEQTQPLSVSSAVN